MNHSSVVGFTSLKIHTIQTLFFQIASLMGFTWIFGYIAAFTGVVALWYIYIILNSLQGLFIFISFICNGRVGLLWSAKLGVNLVRQKSKTSSGGTTSRYNSAQNTRLTGYSSANQYPAGKCEVTQPLQGEDRV